MNSTIRAVSVATRPVELEIDIRGSRPHIGKSHVAEIIRRALATHGFAVKVDSTDNDSGMFQLLTDAELLENSRGIHHKLTPQVTILDQNARTQGKK